MIQAPPPSSNLSGQSRPALPTSATPRLLRLPEVIKRTGLSRSAIYAAEATGRFPTRVCLTARAVAWVETELDQWVMERIASRSIEAKAA
ncbi:AlpA family phage regulatory protein [Pseudoxanthomonas sp. CAU 1598]|uniref:AlpA family phage regulatory protein n=2 Tax=Pseudomarimonas arenosa TaxID=2774145 RepID=A0AAW3ZKV1_9GAMM|nr:AlpA family phage regulatory protein [Pseudomarimonas arenosa]MBD8525314.1 AlpA family phage regulatory protein [Pseudomarimonas arenosa]